ncbi:MULTISPECIES: class I SAM-dependent methyltransferase [Methanobacterium]|jgi:ubiquinone/menaquinone biosynthesis C-methylase UbiE|uniref:Class I SAM-dependent methyltransferase n=1 Tax=Methanobacterium veterum TaxID=408577 RepID=A0A9E5DKJ9_9EURY|nr:MULTISPECIES: class I SAM-dependent methyltransferase [Methanobacterium]MCZ3364859.1 class I SAM-dependent methyltransferase [Methanobacterium veterum]MCZ3372614.1 class I SAM-dependent methyltransferase [Methanobacterium veterum]
MAESEKHFHHGRSSKEILDSNRVLSTVGLKKGDTFLDAGCGDGYMSIAASKIVSNEGKIIAVDVWEESINAFKEKIESENIKNIDAEVANITQKIPVDDESIDILYMGNVLHGFVENNEVETVMKEIHRVIKKGGSFAVVEFKKEESTHGPPLHVRITPEDIEKIVKNYGFSVNKVEEVGTYHYAIILTKN